MRARTGDLCLTLMGEGMSLTARLKLVARTGDGNEVCNDEEGAAVEVCNDEIGSVVDKADLMLGEEAALDLLC